VRCQALCLRDGIAVVSFASGIAYQPS